MRYLLLPICILILTSCQGSDNPVESQDSTSTPVYVSIVLHYEESFVQTEEYFLRQRNDLLSLANYLDEQGITLNLQPDWAFMAAIESFEDSSMRAATNDKNILRFLSEDLGHEIDPHAHEHGWNYADVAYLINDLGVVPSNIAGGLIIDPPEDSIYNHFLDPIEASHYPGYIWQAEWLWGDATGNHVEDTPASGIWRPKDQDNFYVHDDNGPIPCIGKYTNDIAGIYDLIDKISSGTLDGTKLYTAAIFVGQGDVASKKDELEENMAALKAYEASGQLRFVSLKVVAEIWQSDYAGQGFIYIQ